MDRGAARDQEARPRRGAIEPRQAQQADAEADRDRHLTPEDTAEREAAQAERHRAGFASESPEAAMEPVGTLRGHRPAKACAATISPHPTPTLPTDPDRTLARPRAQNPSSVQPRVQAGPRRGTQLG
jgi:hypothetical protein